MPEGSAAPGLAGAPPGTATEGACRALPAPEYSMKRAREQPEPGSNTSAQVARPRPRLGDQRQRRKYLYYGAAQQGPGSTAEVGQPVGSAEVGAAGPPPGRAAEGLIGPLGSAVEGITDSLGTAAKGASGDLPAPDRTMQRNGEQPEPDPTPSAQVAHGRPQLGGQRQRSRCLYFGAARQGAGSQAEVGVPGASAAEGAGFDLPAGLPNLGNTCYVNAALQARLRESALIRSPEEQGPRKHLLL